MREEKIKESLFWKNISSLLRAGRTEVYFALILKSFVKIGILILLYLILKEFKEANPFLLWFEITIGIYVPLEITLAAVRYRRHLKTLSTIEKLTDDGQNS